jgi:ADP-heptose:LPS heptosyltransferase
MDSSIDEIIEIKNINPRKLFGRINEIFKIISAIRSRKFDIVLDLHCALITNIISIFSDSPLKFGIDKRNELGLKVLKYSPLPKDKEIHRINAYSSILNLTGIDNQEIKYSFRIPPKNKDKTLNLLKEYGYSSREAVIALHPGTAWEIKQWGIEKFAEASSILTTRYDTKLIIIYGHQEKCFEQDKITKLFSPKAKFALCPSIKELAALLERCDLLIGNDSGPIHLAAALGITTISIFGPSNHLVSGPFGNKHKIIRKNLPCSPCYSIFDVKYKCKNRNQNCLKLLSVEDVLKEVEPIVTKIIKIKHEKNNI